MTTPEFFTAIVTATGRLSHMPDAAGAVDADIYRNGAQIGAVVLLPNEDGDLDRWGDCLETWADDDLDAWLDESDNALCISQIIVAVRVAVAARPVGGRPLTAEAVRSAAVNVRLSPKELQRLDALRGDTPRARWLRERGLEDDVEDDA